MARILAGTRDGLHAFDVGGAPAGVEHAGRRVTALAPGAGYGSLWAILDRREVWHAEGPDGWRQIVAVGELDAHCIADTDAGILVGTAEAHLRRFDRGAIHPVVSFDGIDGRDGWYTPWGGPPDVRSISEDDGAVYVNVHVGGIPRTTDRTETWRPTIDVDADVHRVWAGRDRVLAACAGGLAVSHDGGGSWTIESDGLHSTYSRAVTVCGDTVLVSASAGPRGGRAALYRRPFAGGPLERCRGGLPELFDGNIDSHRLDAVPDLAAFGTDDGRIFASDDEAATWGLVADGLPPIECVLVVP